MNNINAKKLDSTQKFGNWLKNKSFISDKEYKKITQDVHNQKKLLNEIQKHDQKVKVDKEKVKYNPKNRHWKIYSVITLCIITFITFYVYSSRSPNINLSRSPSSFNSPNQGKSLTYSNVLKNSQDEFINVKTDVVFKLYLTPQTDAPIHITSCLGKNGITPSFKGEYSVMLGKDCGARLIPNSIFKQYKELYLGISINGNPEKPREKIVLTSNTPNVTEFPKKALKDYIKLDTLFNNQKEGVIEIENPVLKSTSGAFSIAGEALMLKTNPFTGGSIYLMPDAQGNTIVTTGKLGIGNLQPQSLLDVKGDASISGNLILSGETAYISSLAGSNLILGKLNLAEGSIQPNLTINTQGYIGVGTREPAHLLDIVQTLKNDSIVAFVNNTNELNTNNSVLKLGLGVGNETSGSEFIQFFSDSTSTSDGNKVGSIELNNGKVVYKSEGADFAEYFPAKSAIPPGFIVSYTKNGLEKATDQSIAIGVVSNTAAFVGNLNVQQNSANNSIVGLLGQVEIYVTNKNGEISSGDKITTSKYSGWGAKAKDNSQIVGLALEDVIDNSQDSIIKNECPKGLNYNKKSLTCKKIKALIQLNLTHE